MIGILYRSPAPQVSGPPGRAARVAARREAAWIHEKLATALAIDPRLLLR
jgi:hypothetical protein